MALMEAIRSIRTSAAELYSEELMKAATAKTPDAEALARAAGNADVLPDEVERDIAAAQRFIELERQLAEVEAKARGIEAQFTPLMDAVRAAADMVAKAPAETSDLQAKRQWAAEEILRLVDGVPGQTCSSPSVRTLLGCTLRGTDTTIGNLRGQLDTIRRQNVRVFPPQSESRGILGRFTSKRTARR